MLADQMETGGIQDSSGANTFSAGQPRLPSHRLRYQPGWYLAKFIGAVYWVTCFDALKIAVFLWTRSAVHPLSGCSGSDDYVGIMAIRMCPGKSDGLCKGHAMDLNPSFAFCLGFSDIVDSSEKTHHQRKAVVKTSPTNNRSFWISFGSWDHLLFRNSVAALTAKSPLSAFTRRFSTHK